MFIGQPQHSLAIDVDVRSCVVNHSCWYVCRVAMVLGVDLNAAIYTRCTQVRHQKGLSNAGAAVHLRMQFWVLLPFCILLDQHWLKWWLVLWWHQVITCINTLLLTLNVRVPSFLGLTRSISWLMMPWLPTSPGHQQPWFWLCRICRSWCYLRKNFIYLCYINVE